MTPQLQGVLLALAEPEYRDFQQALIPGVENLIGVRLPLLRRMAAQLARPSKKAPAQPLPGTVLCGAWRAEFACPDVYLEELLLRGMVIGLLAAQLPKEEYFSLIRDYIPRIGDWCSCDTFCSSLKTAKYYNEESFALAVEYAARPQEFACRFGVVLLRHWALTGQVQRVLTALAGVACPDFYARMALAWCYADCAAVDFEATLAAMTAAGLEDFTWNKALQKMRESRRISPAQKELCKQWKRT